MSCGAVSPSSPPSTTPPAALRAAASCGDAVTCGRLLAGHRSVRFTRDELGRSALHLAASAGHAPVVRTLLAAAAPKEVDSPDGAGCTALQRAAAEGHEEVVRLLLARGADVNRQDSVHGNTALHEASWKGYSRTVSLLCTAGADLTRTNSSGFAALHLCCQNGHNQTCRELLLAGCDPDLQNNYGDTALHTAARYGHAGVTRILISAKCAVSERNKNGDTALHIAAAMGRRKLTRILLEAGCERALRNKQSETARDIAVRKELAEIVAILDGHGAPKGKKATKKRSKSKVRFDGKGGEAAKATSPEDKPRKHWSPYGCHYYPDPDAFPAPRLDSLPDEPLRRGEQYYLDLAGNICKGPIGVGYTCYCAPLFRHLEARLERDKRELTRAQLKLGQRVAGLEQRLSRGTYVRRSERTATCTQREVEEPGKMVRSRSLEVLDRNGDSGGGIAHATRSMEALDPPDQEPTPRCSVKELVARIQAQQQQQPLDADPSSPTPLHLHPHLNNGNRSESSDDDDAPSRYYHHQPQPPHPNYHPDDLPENAPPRSRSGVYSPTIVQIAHHHHQQQQQQPFRYGHSEIRNIRLCDPVAGDGAGGAGGKYVDLNARFAKLRILEGAKEARVGRTTGDVVMGGDVGDNNDSGYSTKVYGSSKGNSPSLSGGGQGDAECLRSSSLV